MLSLVWQTHRGYTLWIVVLRLTRGILPVAILYVGKLIVDAVLASSGTGTGWHLILPFVFLELALVVIADSLSRGARLVESSISDLVSIRASTLIMERAATLDLAHFEDPTLYDRLDRARRQATGRIGTLQTVLGLVEGWITLATLSVATFAISPWLLILLLIAVLPSFVGETRFASLQYLLTYRWTQQQRELDYMRHVGASKEAAKEVQLYGLAPWLKARFLRISNQWQKDRHGLAVRRTVVSAALALFSTLAYYAAYLVVISRTIAGELTLGTLTFLTATFVRSRDLVQSMLSSLASLYDEGLYLRDLFQFLDVSPAIVSRPGARQVPKPISAGLVFDNVGFRYGGSSQWVIRNVSFRVRPGEKVALVGENGAGKTTITKLIARLYDPTEGQILLDNVDLREYDLVSLRESVGVIFQDFVRFDFRFDENIGVGEIAAVSDYLDGAWSSTVAVTNGERRASRVVNSTNDDSAVPAALRAASDRSRASALLPHFPDRWRQMLGHRFDGGTELSGGEWQRIALARAYMRDAQLLILDEPTAALDARAELELFLRFASVLGGRTAILISHRFSTVRMADRIVVLRDGRVVEDGSHEDLVARRGLYWELFEMQAQAYR